MTRTAWRFARCLSAPCYLAPNRIASSDSFQGAGIVFRAPDDGRGDPWPRSGAPLPHEVAVAVAAERVAARDVAVAVALEQLQEHRARAAELGQEIIDDLDDDGRTRSEERRVGKEW